MLIKETVLKFITQHALINAHDTIIVGFSGGPDSLFLLHMLAHLRHSKNLTLIAAHLDHEWRSSSSSEAALCKERAEQLGVTFISARISELDMNKKSSGSLEELGRRARRFFLEQVRSTYNAHAIALAHHADDQEETFFMRMIRGSTISGLCCMKPKDGYYIRPLLGLYKQEILAYLDLNTMPYIIDPSNMSDNYLRTRIRNHVIPALRKSDSRFDANFQRTVHHIHQADAFIERLTEKTFSTIATYKENKWHVDVESLFALDSFLQERIILYWLIKSKVPFVPTQKFIHEIKRFLQHAGTKTHALHILWKIVKNKKTAFIQER